MSAVTAFVVEEYRPIAKGAWRGWLIVMQPSGQRIHDCGLFERDGHWWVAPPSKPRLGRDGQQRRDANGKAQWSPVVSFATKELADKWSDAVLAALRVSHPLVLNEQAPT